MSKLTKITSPKTILRLLKKERIGKKNLYIIYFLDSEKNIISIHKQIIKNQINLKLSDIFVPAFYLAARIILIVHIKNNQENNQLKNLIKPTKNEITFTKKAFTTGCFLNISILDHLIINKNSYYSFHESGII